LNSSIDAGIDAVSKAKTPLRLHALDAARHLESDDAVAECRATALQTEDPNLLLLALGDVARAKGMAHVAKNAGVGRESLCKALAPGARPRFDTAMKVARAGPCNSGGAATRGAAQPDG